MKKIQGLYAAPYLNLDSGNLLFKKEHVSPGLLQQTKITAAGIIDAYNYMDYDAVAVGRNDLAAGLSFLKDQAARAEFTWLSANIIRKSTGNTIFPASLTRQMGNLKVGIVGLTAYDKFHRFEKNDDAVLLPWQKVLPELVAELSDSCDLIILLSNNTLDQNRLIAESFPDIHIIFQSAPRAGNIAPDLFNKSLIAQTGKQGKYLGWMLVDWQKSGIWGRKGAAKELATKKMELDGLNGRINRIERREPEATLSAHKSYQNLLAQKEQLLSEIIFLENELYDLKESGQAPSTYENNFIALDINLPDQPEVQKIVQTTKEKVNKSGRTQADKSASLPVLPELQLETLEFTGWMTCVACHTAQSDFWKKTGHSSAYQSLVEQEQQYNLDCLPCHVTAEYQDIKISNDDAILLALPEALRQVGCEVCHGPGKKHASSQHPSDISRNPQESICIRCHNPERDEQFNYDNDIERIACPASLP